MVSSSFLVSVRSSPVIGRSMGPTVLSSVYRRFEYGVPAWHRCLWALHATIPANPDHNLTNSVIIGSSFRVMLGVCNTPLPDRWRRMDATAAHRRRSPAEPRAHPEPA